MRVADRRPLRVTAFFERLGTLFVDGRLREMTTFWAFPCPVEVSGELVVMRSPELLEMFFGARLAAAKAAGLTAMVPRVIAVEMPRSGRFRVWLRWIYRFGAQETEDERASVFYMARESMREMRIEMMDIVPEARSED